MPYSLFYFVIQNCSKQLVLRNFNYYNYTVLYILDATCNYLLLNVLYFYGEHPNILVFISTRKLQPY